MDGAGWSEGPLIYVAGAYDTGDKAVNLQRAFAAAENVVNRGAFPIVPHMCHLWHSKYFYHKSVFWLNYSMRLLTLCHGMIICPGSEFSAGVKAERIKALELGIPVLNYDEFLRLEAFPMIPLHEEVDYDARPDAAIGSEGTDVRPAGEPVPSDDVDKEDASNTSDLRDERQD